MLNGVGSITLKCPLRDETYYKRSCVPNVPKMSNRKNILLCHWHWHDQIGIQMLIMIDFDRYVKFPLNMRHLLYLLIVTQSFDLIKNKLLFSKE